MAVHEPLAQRVVVRHHVAPLEHDEIESYLTHLLRLAGTELMLFEPAAIAALYQATNGLARKINRLAHHALNAATIRKAKTVSAEDVEAAMPEVS